MFGGASPPAWLWPPAALNYEAQGRQCPPRRVSLGRLWYDHFPIVAWQHRRYTCFQRVDPVKTATIHQIMPGFLYGDALGNQAQQIRKTLRGWGYRSQVYAQFRDRRLEDPGRDYRRYPGSSDDVVIFHYSIGSPLTQSVRQLSGRVVPYYHNVTPARFLRGYNEPLADLLDQGRRELTLFRDAPFALAASEYNRQEMLELGFREVEVLPYFITFDVLRESADSTAGQQMAQRYDDGATNLLFVGRLVPNKCQDDLIRSLCAYHHLLDPNSRLLLVGSEANAPGYRLELEAMAAALDLAERVHILGGVGPREGLGGLYQIADLFLCLSEHEGFCIPLLEAMAFDLPVLAYRSTGVPYAMGGAGVLINAKRYDAIAELMDLLVRDQSLRQSVIAGQRRRLHELAPEQVREKLSACIERISG
jgi:glycosyltransferase involved in cell wall biosynthesis